jgi:hypothetical protein
LKLEILFFSISDFVGSGKKISQRAVEKQVQIVVHALLGINTTFTTKVYYREMQIKLSKLGLKSVHSDIRDSETRRLFRMDKSSLENLPEYIRVIGNTDIAMVATYLHSMIPT